MKIKTPFLFYLPFLAIYGFLVFMMHDDAMVGDEDRYMMFAQNLLNGHYSPNDQLNLWNGPGYPLLLTPFLWLKLPTISITLFNALLHYLSVVFVFKSVNLISGKKSAHFFGLAWGLYFVAWQSLQYIMAECLSIFLISLLSYFIIKSHSSNKSTSVIWAGLTLGFLALTKIIFAYVIAACLVIYILYFVYQKAKPSGALKILMVSIIPLIPYLIYTYSLTGRPLYLGNSGGMSLYFMSTPHEGEFGDWNNETFTGYCNGGVQPCNSGYFVKNHKTNFEYILSVDGVERDDRYKELALENIKNNPIKFLRNCLANQGRMWFRYPFSYRFQNDLYLGVAFPNAILFSAFIFLSIFWMARLKYIRKDLNLIFLILIVYLGGSTLLSAYPRQLYTVVPMMMTLISFAFSRSVKIELFAKKSTKN